MRRIAEQPKEKWIQRECHVLREHARADIIRRGRLLENLRHDSEELVPYLFSLQHFLLFQYFHSVYLASITFLHQSYLVALRSISIKHFEVGRELNPKLTSPKAPFPMILTVPKSWTPIFILLNLRNSDSFLPRSINCRCFRSCVATLLLNNFRSSSTRLGQKKKFVFPTSS